MNHSFLKHLHPDDVTYWLHVEKATGDLREARRVRKQKIFLFPTMRTWIDCGEGTLLYGRCRYQPDNQHDISITVRKFDKTNGWSRHRLPTFQILDTICHELGHVMSGDEKADHGPKFFREFGKFCGLVGKTDALKTLESVK